MGRPDLGACFNRAVNQFLAHSQSLRPTCQACNRLFFRSSNALEVGPKGRAGDRIDQGRPVEQRLENARCDCGLAGLQMGIRVC